MITTDQLQQIRRETDGVEEVIHLNNAGASLPPVSVTRTLVEYLEEEARTGGYELASDRRKSIQGFYRAVADLVGTSPDRIAYTTSATDAYHKALGAIPWQEGDVLITTINDYSSNQIAFLQLQKRFGVKVIRAEDSPQGGVSLEQIEQLILRHHPRLVAVTHVPTNSGLVQPVAAIGRICRKEGCWYLVDACQSAGQLPLDLDSIGADFLTATFRKFMRGPRGTGFLACSERVLTEGLEPLFLDLYSAEWDAPDNYLPVETARRFEWFERSYGLLLGAAEAARYAQEIGLEAIAHRVGELAQFTREELASVSNLQLTDRGTTLCGIVSFHIEEVDPGRLALKLRQQGVNCSVARIPNAPLDLQQKGVSWAMRFAPHYYNTREEIQRAVSELKALV